MSKNVNELIARQREIHNRLGDIKDLAATRELTSEEKAEEKSLIREYGDNKDEITLLNQEREAQRLNPVVKDENERLREFFKNARPGDRFTIQNRASMSTSATTPYVQGLKVVDLINNDRPDADILTAAGVPMTTGVRGNKIQWAFAGGVEAVFANELAQTTERTIDLDKQNPVQQRLTIRVRISNQSLENSDYDLRAYIIQAVNDSIRKKVNWAACSTTKATTTFYGGFAQDAESGTYGASGYVAGKQTGTYTALSKTVFAEMIGKLATRNIPTDHAVFVVGAEDYWTLKVTAFDAGSGIMLLGNDGKILGIPVICNNAINRATEKGAVSGHNIGLGDFAGLPVMQHGDIRLSIDGASAYAADTDEVIVTINADFSMTVLKDLADGFVVYSKSE